MDARNTRKSAGPTIGELAVHLAMGALLGTLFSLYLIVSDTGHVFEMIVQASAPRLTTLAFVGVFASVFGVGATLTGAIFTAMEKS